MWLATTHFQIHNLSTPFPIFDSCLSNQTVLLEGETDFTHASLLAGVPEPEDVIMKDTLEKHAQGMGWIRRTIFLTQTW